MKKIALLSLLLFFISLTSRAETVLKVAFGETLAPWVIPETEQGILVDIAKDSLEAANYKVLPVYYPYARRIRAYKNKQVDVVTDINPSVIEKEKLSGYLSTLFYHHQNVAVALAKNNYQLNELKDLSSLRALAWQGALVTSSPKYIEIMSKNPFYRETHDQETQIMMLFRERTDVLAVDMLIFKYYRLLVAAERSVDTTVSVDIFPLFKKSYGGFLFRDKTARDRFNEQIKKMKQAGKLEMIYASYLQ